MSNASSEHTRKGAKVRNSKGDLPRIADEAMICTFEKSISSGFDINQGSSEDNHIGICECEILEIVP